MRRVSLPFSLPFTEELIALATRVVWFKEPRDALANVGHLVAHALTYGTHADVKTLRHYLSDDELRAALDAAPAGVFDERSWAYWNLVLGRADAPRPPARVIP